MFFKTGTYNLKSFLLPTPVVWGNKQEYFVWYVLKLHWVLFLFFGFARLYSLHLTWILTLLSWVFRTSPLWLGVKLFFYCDRNQLQAECPQTAILDCYECYCWNFLVRTAIYYNKPLSFTFCLYTSWSMMLSALRLRLSRAIAVLSLCAFVAHMGLYLYLCAVILNWTCMSIIRYNTRAFISIFSFLVAAHSSVAL